MTKSLQAGRDMVNYISQVREGQRYRLKIEMEVRAMKCTKCSRYSYPLRRCLDGMINPKSIKAGVEAARFMGISYICGIDAENGTKKVKVAKKLNNN